MTKRNIILAAVGVIAVAGIAAALVLSGVVGSGRGQPGILVNGRLIPAGAQGKQSARDKKDKRMQENYRQAMSESRIINELFKQEAERRGLSVGDAAVDGALAQVRAAYAGVEQFNDALKKLGVTEAQYREQISDQLLVAKAKEDIVKNVTVSDPEVLDYYQRRQQEFADADGQIKPFSEARELVREKALANKRWNVLTEFTIKLRKSAKVTTPE